MVEGVQQGPVLVGTFLQAFFEPQVNFDNKISCCSLHANTQNPLIVQALLAPNRKRGAPNPQEV